jgi:protocatechuate 3,4-dioxygenase beta subunit
MLRQFCLLLTLFVFSASAVIAQTNGTIAGNVRDASGAEVSGATVTVTNTQTNATRVDTTNQAGLYTFPALAPGFYTVKAEAPGFQSIVRNGIELQV